MQVENMKRLFMLYRSYEPNTASINRAFGYISELSNYGCEINVCFFWPDSTKARVKKYYPNVHYKYYWEKLPQGLWSKYLSYTIAVRRFLGQLKDGDVVYVYNMQDLMPRLVEKKGIKVFHELTEHPSVYRFGTRLHYISIEKYLEACKKLNGLFVISTALRDYFVQNGISAEKVTIVNMTVDPSRFENVKKQMIGRYIAYCGMVTNEKDGVSDLIKAFAKVAKKIADVRLYVIGSIPSQTEQQENVRLIYNLGIKDRVVLTGAITAGEMPQILKNAEVLALARPDNLQAKYGFPTKLGEYLLTRNPVVVTKVGDIPLFLKNGESALICTPGDVNSIAMALDWALSHPLEAQNIGDNGCDVAMRHFNNINETKKLLDAFRFK